MDGVKLTKFEQIHKEAEEVFNEFAGSCETWDALEQALTKAIERTFEECVEVAKREVEHARMQRNQAYENQRHDRFHFWNGAGTQAANLVASFRVLLESTP